jgi:GNAT superfamily N-acetyltransferase
VILSLTPEEIAANIPALSALLEAVVGGGASIGFLWPMSPGEADTFWRSCIAPVAEGSKVLFVARDDAGDIIGTGQLDLAQRANGRHRAEIVKVMVHPSARRHGIGRALMQALEDEARRLGCTTLHLDTVAGAPAEHLYRGLGWTLVGGIPNYATDPDGALEKNAIYYKLLGGGSP